MQKTKILENYVGQPFAIAYIPNKYKLVWDWRNVVHARIGFLHDDFDHGFIRHLKHYARANETSILHLTTDNIKDRFMATDTMDIIQYEGPPTEVGLKDLEGNRMRMVELFFKSVCYKECVSRQDLIPQMQYFRDQEGPIMGFLRGIHLMEDKEKQSVLFNHLEKIRMVEWGLIYNELDKISDYVYVIEGETLADKVESFIIGVWAVFVMHLNRHQDEMGFQRILTLLQLGEEMVKRENDSKAKEIILEGVEMLATLTKPFYDNMFVVPYHSLVVQSSSLFPNVYNTISHMFYGKMKVSDFDLAEGHENVVPFGANEVILNSKVVYENEKYIARMKIVVAE